MKYLKGILLPALLALASVAAGKKDAPLVEVTEFDNELVNLLYFEDSEIALATELETGVVWRSSDAGKKWKKQDIRTALVLKNPFDKKVAIALGDTTHYITYDQGKTWDEFKTKYSFSYGQPVSFHATDNKKILYHTFEDPFSGIGLVSHYLVLEMPL
jgi:photosystem II stability/assembly factor-like uncharacterized protein